MVKGTMDLKALNLEELSGVVSIYPWYAGARAELCRRMSELGHGAWSDDRYADAAMYFGSRKIVAAYAESVNKEDIADNDVKNLVRQELTSPAEKKQIVVVGGDFFSKSQYDSVKDAGEGIFRSFAEKADKETIVDLCTEALAEIYLDQDYSEQAVEIYSKLSLRYPEKSAYFAALIEKINRKSTI